MLPQIISCMKLKHISFLFVLLASSLLSQKDVNVSLLTVNDGLSQGMVFDIIQSKDGFLWIATKDGLNRFDGSRFEVSVPDAYNPFSIGDSEVRVVFEDSRGWIWLMLPFGIDVFDPASGLFFHVKNNGFLKSGAYGDYTIIETADGAIWFNDKQQLCRLNVTDDLLANAQKKSSSVLEPSCKIISMSAVKGWTNKTLTPDVLLYTLDKKILIGTNDGIFQIDPKTEKITPYFPKSDWAIRSMKEDAKGRIMVVLKDEILSKVAAKVRWIFIDSERIQYFDDPEKNPTKSITFSRDGYLWTYRNSKVQKWNVQAFLSNGKPELEIKAEDICGVSTMGINKYLFDKSGVLWLGLNGYGMTSIYEKKKNFRSFLSNFSQRRFLEAPDGGIFSMFHPTEKYSSIYFQKASNHQDFITEVKGNEENAWNAEFTCFDIDGNGWTAIVDQLKRLDLKTKSVRTFNVPGYGILIDHAKYIIRVSEKGLWRFDPKKEIAVLYPFDKVIKKTSTFSHFIYEDIDHNIWIFGFEGLIKAMPLGTGYKFEYYINNHANVQSISSNDVLSVCDDPVNPKKYLWVGTKAGMNKLDKQSGKCKHYQKEQGLPDNVVYGILSEDVSKNKPTHIWLSTNKGLCRFNLSDESVRNFTSSDGLQSNEFNSSSYYKTRDGHMLFGGVNGVTVFHPDSLIFNSNIPTTSIVKLHVNNKIYNKPLNARISLSHDENLINIDFAALEYTNPSQNQYKYQLEGVDKTWVDLGYKNNVQFANLAPGTYTFKVMGSNNDGIWSTDATELQFTIRPPWWASWWAYLFYLAILAWVIKAFYHYSLTQKLEHQKSAKLREMDEFKNRFFTNITHEFRTPLTVILGMSEQLANEEKDQNRIKKIGLIKRNGDNLLRLINQILDLSKLESNTMKLNYIQGDILAYIKYICESLHSLANAQNILLRVESDQAKIEMDYDPDRFLQIMYNLLSNAIKFTPSGGKVMLRANLNGPWLHISVTDTGAGIPDEEIPFLFERFFQAKNQEHAKAGGSGIGLALTSELIKVMGGEIQVESKLGTGTTFLVKLPVTHLAGKDALATVHDGELKKRLSFLSNSPASLIDEITIDQMDKSQLPHILIIEDNPDVIEYLTACLQNTFHLEYAFNGQAGIEKALDAIPDIIVSDVMMPIKDGFDVLETLKHDELTSHIPIVLLTAKADIQSRLIGLRKGADAYLSKPFHQEELLVTIENLLDSRRLLQLKYQEKTINQDLSLTDKIDDVEDAFLQKFRTVVEKNLSDPDFEMPQLERALAMSRSQIYRKIKALTDKSPSLLIRSIRLHHGRHLLLTTQLTVSEIAYGVGYNALNNFSDAYLDEFGERPMKTRGA